MSCYELDEVLKRLTSSLQINGVGRAHKKTIGRNA